jgi:LacI family transcriptional regulator
MPPSYKRKLGMEGVVAWAKEWRADVVIAQFDPDDDVTLFRKNGIVAMAQDYISKFDTIPNITGDYTLTGTMAAEYFISKGFTNFGFFGYNGVCWSDERCEAFRARIEKSSLGGSFYMYDGQNIDNMWYYDQSELTEWLISLPKPIAIMACDDNQGNMLLQACELCGIHVPFDVAIIGVTMTRSSATCRIRRCRQSMSTSSAVERTPQLWQNAWSKILHIKAKTWSSSLLLWWKDCRLLFLPPMTRRCSWH